MKTLNSQNVGANGIRQMVIIIIALLMVSCGGSKAQNADLYAGMPDKMFPVPTVDGKVVPYDEFYPGEEGYEVTTYKFKGKSLMKSYQEQLREKGFVDYGSASYIESLWRYERSEDGATLVIEMFHEEDTFIINMYVTSL